MAELCPNSKMGKSGVLAYFLLKIGCFGHIFWDMDVKLVLPLIYINIKEQTQLGVNWTQINHFIKMAISQNAILAKCQLAPKSIKDIRKFLPIFYPPAPLSACVRIFRPPRTSDFFLKIQHHSIMIIFMNFYYFLLLAE